MSQTPAEQEDDDTVVIPLPFNAAIRQQAYLEQVKLNEEDGFNETAVALALLLGALLLRYDYEKVSDMPRRVLANFTAEFAKEAKVLGNKFNREFTRRLKEIANVDADVTRLVYEKLNARRVKVPNKPLLWQRSRDDLVSATGVKPLDMVRDFTASVVRNTGNLIGRAWAEKWTPAQLLRELNGTRDRNFKNGLANKLKNQFASMMHTLVQHFHSWLKFNVGKLFYLRYQWISVIDAGTTEVCRSRNLKVYTYADGPTPPAHYRCRSTIMGLPAEATARKDLPTNFYDWLKNQPPSIAADLIGAKQGKELSANRLGAKDSYSPTKKLTPAQYRNKLSKMTEE